MNSTVMAYQGVLLNVDSFYAVNVYVRFALRELCSKDYIIDKNYFVDICMQRAWFEDTDRISFL